MLDYLVAHYKMNDNAADTNVVDSSGNGHTGTSQQNTEDINVTGKINGALSFNGTSDLITVPNSPAFNFGSGGFGISFWIYPTLGTQKGSVFNFLTDVPNNASIWISVNYPNQLSVTVAVDSDGSAPWWDLINPDSGGNGVGTVNKLTLNEWNHVVFTRVGNNWKTYINATVDLNLTVLGAIYDATSSLRMGYLFSADPSRYEGYMDNMMIFNKGLSLSEVKRLYNDGSGVEDIPLVETLTPSTILSRTGHRFSSQQEI